MGSASRKGRSLAGRHTAPASKPAASSPDPGEAGPDPLRASRMRRRKRRLGWVVIVTAPVFTRLGPTVGTLLAALVAGGGIWLLRKGRPPGHVGWVRSVSSTSVLTAPWAAKTWGWVDRRREVDRQRSRFHWRIAASVGLVLGGMWPMFVATGFYGALNYGSLVPGVLSRCLAGAVLGVLAVTGGRALGERFLPVLPQLGRIAMRAVVLSLSVGVVLATTLMANRAGTELRTPGVKSVGLRSMAPILMPKTYRPFSARPAPRQRLVELLGSEADASATLRDLDVLLSHDLLLVHTHAEGGLWALFDRTAAEGVTLSPLILDLDP